MTPHFPSVKVLNVRRTKKNKESPKTKYLVPEGTERRGRKLCVECVES